MTRTLLASLLILPLAACGGDPSGTSTTKLDAVEVEPGTISDSMIILDDASGDGTAVDNSVPSDDAANPAEKTDEEAEESDGGDAETAAAAPAPALKKAASPDTPAKKGE